MVSNTDQQLDTLQEVTIEKCIEALNNLVGMDIGYLGDSDENVNILVAALRKLIDLQQEKEELNIELEVMRGVANSYKKRTEELLVENKRLKKIN